MIKLEIFSFSFREFLIFKSIAFDPPIQRVQNKIAIQRALDEYLQWGGYYSVIANDDAMVKKEYLERNEIDFVTRDALYQVTVTLNDPEIRKRGLRPLIDSKTDKQKVVIVQEATSDHIIEGIEIVSLADWLLS